MAARILSDAHVDEMVELREQGISLLQIAKHLTARGTAISRGAVWWRLLRLGVEPPARMQRPLGGSCGRGRSFTPDEDAKLLALEAEGCSLAAIGREVGRDTNSVIGRLATLARMQARAEGGSV
jgi:hypothetical protein